MCGRTKLLASLWQGRRKKEQKEEYDIEEEEEKKEEMKKRGEEVFGHKMHLQKQAPVAQFLQLGAIS